MLGLGLALPLKASLAGGGPPPVTVPTLLNVNTRDLDTDAGGAGALVIPYPAGVATNVIAIFHGTTNNAASTPHTFNTPAGFTAVVDQMYKDQFRQGLFWRRLDGSESGNVTLSNTVGDANWSFVGSLSLWAGCTTSGTPYEGLSEVANGESTDYQTGAVTTLGANRKILGFAAGDANLTGTPGAGWTRIFGLGTNQGTSTNAFAECVAIDRASAGVEPAMTHTKSHSRWGTISIALKPV